ncbi:MAG: signal peptidase II [Deinococcales bacterium]
MALLLAALLVAADQISKAWVVAALPEGSREVPLGLGFYIVHIRNNGAAFGMLRNLHLKVGPVDVDGTILLGILSAVVALVIALYLARNGGRLAALTRVALALVLAGAVGNMIDRFRLHYVVDFIHFHVRGFDRRRQHRHRGGAVAPGERAPLRHSGGEGGLDRCALAEASAHRCLAYRGTRLPRPATAAPGTASGAAPRTARRRGPWRRALTRAG